MSYYNEVLEKMFRLHQKQLALIAKDRKPIVASGTVYVCPLKDTECGFRVSWCASCPQRKVLENLSALYEE